VGVPPEERHDKGNLAARRARKATGLLMGGGSRATERQEEAYMAVQPFLVENYQLALGHALSATWRGTTLRARGDVACYGGDHRFHRLFPNRRHPCPNPVLIALVAFKRTKSTTRRTPPEPLPITGTLLTSFTGAVTAIVALYFGATAFVQPRRGWVQERCGRGSQ
jgi:hypothetical protein